MQSKQLPRQQALRYVMRNVEPSDPVVLALKGPALLPLVMAQLKQLKPNEWFDSLDGLLSLENADQAQPR